MKAIVERIVARLLDPTEQRPLAIAAQGALVCVVGLGLAVSGYVRRGFRWPVEARG